MRRRRGSRRALVRSTFDLAADFAEADATGAGDLAQQLARVDLDKDRKREEAIENGGRRRDVAEEDAQSCVGRGRVTNRPRPLRVVARRSASDGHSRSHQ